MPTSMSFHARRHAICHHIHLPHSVLLALHSFQHFPPSPFSSPHFSTFNFFPPLSLISIPSHEQKRCTKSKFFFFSFSSHSSTQLTQRNQASSAWIIYVSIPPGGIYLAHTSKRRVSGCCLGSGRKGRCDIIAGIKN